MIEVATEDGPVRVADDGTIDVPGLDALLGRLVAQGAWVRHPYEGEVPAARDLTAAVGLVLEVYPGAAFDGLVDANDPPPPPPDTALPV